MCPDQISSSASSTILSQRKMSRWGCWSPKFLSRRSPRAQGSSKLNPESACDLCVAQVVTFRTSIHEQYEYDYTTKHGIFHEPCDHCDKENLEVRIQMCDPCRHLRLRHLVCCSPSLKLDSTLLLRSSRENLDRCDLCTFWDTVDARLSQRMDHRASERTEASEDEGQEQPDWTTIEHKLDHIKHGSFFFFLRKSRPGSGFGTGTGIQAEFSRRDRQWVPPYVDWDWLQDWLNDVPEPRVSKQTISWVPQELRELRVIDVLSGCVVQSPPKSQYLALSYVWGSDAGDHLRCLRSNINALSQPGALTEISLPRTITDAISVCQRLHHRYLWVDRLCVIQDDTAEALSSQLDQMADIYYLAALTLVAASGEGATHGLASVSYARDVEQAVCDYDNDFKLITPIPLLQELLPEIRWWDRGWTYQEYVASRRLLFFTDSGLHLKSDRRSNKILSEGYNERNPKYPELPGATPGYSYLEGQELDFKMVESYTTRKLTYASDILRASSGFLRALYGDRSSYGMPWDEFDRAILWMPKVFSRGTRRYNNTEVFPTWSWISSMDSVSVLDVRDSVISLAYWGRPITSGKTSPRPIRWFTMPPTHAHLPASKTMQVRSPKTRISTGFFDPDKEPEPEPEDHALDRYIVAGLCWAHGCIQTEAPRWLSVDCTRSEYGARLQERWATSTSLFWKDAFQSYGGAFAKVDPALLSIAGSLMVYTQKTSFALDWRAKHQPPIRRRKSLPEQCPVLVRTDDHEIAGAFSVSECSAQRLQQSNQTHATFIALSSGSYGFKDEILLDYVDEHLQYLSVSAFYGCPCSVEKDVPDDVEHIRVCPEHPDFHSVEPARDRDSYSSWAGEHFRLHDKAHLHHLEQLGYRDVNNDWLHKPKHPPFLWVMIIVPRDEIGVQSKVYERIAIGKIYLKRWVEASPVFEPLVLV